MEDQTTWKGHTFTLLVFTGIVVLCSIFFILGMLVGRAQGQKIASVTPAETANTETLLEAKDEKPKLTFYDSVKKEQPAVLEPPPVKPDPPPVREEAAKTKVKPEAKAESKPQAPKAEAPPPVTSKPQNVINFQVSAIRKPADAEKLLNEVKKKGFRAFILAPPANDPNPFFRVQVGPFSDPVEAEDVKKKLETAGYKPILKK